MPRVRPQSGASRAPVFAGHARCARAWSSVPVARGQQLAVPRRRLWSPHAQVHAPHGARARADGCGRCVQPHAGPPGLGGGKAAAERPADCARPPQLACAGAAYAPLAPRLRWEVPVSTPCTERSAASPRCRLWHAAAQVIVRAEEITISGGLVRQKMKYERFLRKRMNSNPQKGPFHFRAPSRIFWRTVRGCGALAPPGRPACWAAARVSTALPALFGPSAVCGEQPSPV